MLKPPWMKAADHRIYRQIHPIFRCSFPGCEETDLAEETVDHIVSRHNGGKNELGNYQPMCRRHNSSKGTGNDTYWSQNFYFDTPIILDATRAAQRNEGYNRILDWMEWFSLPFSQISGVLYTLAWVVGAGKTLSIPVIGFALNHIIRRERGLVAPRVNRILVLSKEQSIRDQITNDLREDVTKYGLCGVDPRVGMITHSGFFDQPQLIDQYDIWASCINMLFENNTPIEHIEKILGMFPLIFVDEPHYAVEQVLRVVQSAPTSLVFGLTGSPIKATGQQLKKFVLFSLFDYHSANLYDQSMKYLVAPEDNNWKDIVEVIDITSADIQCGGRSLTIEKINTPEVTDDYYRNLRPVIAVAESVLRYVHECDEGYPEGFALLQHKAAPHRHVTDCVPDLVYPVHAMIEVETIDIGNYVCEKMNGMVESDRLKYPEDRGYRFELVMSDVTERDGSGNVKTTKGKRLKTDHDWMYAKHNNGKVGKDSARFLVCVNMGREGIHNQFTGVVGVARRIGSMIDVVQRAIGRQLRAHTKRVNGMLHVPPARLDTVKIITHLAFGNEEIIEQAVRYILDMAGALNEMPTMDDLLEEKHDTEDLKAIDPDAILTTVDKISIGGQVGIELMGGKEPDKIHLTPIIDLYGTNPARRQKAVDWVQLVLRNPSGAATSIGLKDSLAEVKRVTREILEFDPSDETLTTFIKRVSPKLAHCCARLDDPLIRSLVLDKYTGHARQYHLPPIPAMTDTVKIKNRIVHAIQSQLGGHLQCKQEDIHSRVYTAIRMILGVPDGEVLRKGEKYDIPENHVILTRPEIDRDIRGWVIASLARSGFCPAIAAAFQIPQESDGAVDAV